MSSTTLEAINYLVDKMASTTGEIVDASWPFLEFMLGIFLWGFISVLIIGAFVAALKNILK